MADNVTESPMPIPRHRRPFYKRHAGKIEISTIAAPALSILDHLLSIPHHHRLHTEILEHGTHGVFAAILIFCVMVYWADRKRD